MMTNLPILRTISNHCCHCSNELEPFKHVLLLCECPTSLCRDCAIQQIIQRDRTYFSSLICPICGADTPLDKGTVSNQDYVHQEEERLVRSLCTILSIPIVKNIKFRSKLSITNFLTVVEAVEEQSKSSEVTGMIFSIFDTNSSSVMTMFLSRLACNLQWMKREEFQLQELNYGALETIEFRRNKFVKDFLVWISNNAPLSMLEEVGDGSGYCNVCGDNDLSVDGVLFSCECKFTICSVCVKRTMMQSLKPLDEGGKCPLCKHTNAFISNEKEAKKEQQSLLSSASNFLNVQIMGTKKALPLDTIWSKYESCGIPPYAFQPLEKEDFLERNYSRKDITKDIFHISRLEAYRISSQSSSTSDSLSLDEESDPRYYGPLSLIHIRKDPFLMILASVIQLSLTTNIASSPMIRDDIGPVNTNTELKLNSMLDTEISNESISLRLLLRKKSTQCPFCGVNPFSNSVLLFHVRQFHPNLVVEVKDLIRFQWQQCCICSSLHPNESEEIPNGAVDDDFVCTRCMNQENIITDVRGVSLRTVNEERLFQSSDSTFDHNAFDPNLQQIKIRILNDYSLPMGGDEWMRNMHPHGNASGALVPYENIMGSYYTYRKERLGSEGARISMPRIRIAFKDCILSTGLYPVSAAADSRKAELLRGVFLTSSFASDSNTIYYKLLEPHRCCKELKAVTTTLFIAYGKVIAAAKNSIRSSAWQQQLQITKLCCDAEIESIMHSALTDKEASVLKTFIKLVYKSIASSKTFVHNCTFMKTLKLLSDEESRKTKQRVGNLTPINCKLTEVDNLFTESITEDADDGVKESSKHEKPISILDKCNNMIVHSPYQSSILPPEPAKPQPPNFGLELGKSRALLKPRSYKRKRIVVSDDEYCEEDRSSSFLPQNDAAIPTQAKVCSFGEAPNLSIIVENQKEGHSKKEETRGSSLLKSSLKSEQSPISKRHKGVHFANELEEVFSIVTVPDPAPAPAHNTDRLSIAYSLMNKYNDALEKQVEIVGVEQEDLVTRQPCPPPAVQKSVTKRSCALYINRNFLMKDTRKDQLKRGKIEKYKCRILDYMPTKSLVNGKLSGFDNQAYIVPTTNMKVLPGVLLSLIAKDDEIEIVEVFDFKLKKIRPLRATLVELGVDPTEQVSIVLAPYDKSQSRSANERYNKLHTSSNSELNSLNLDVLNFQSSIGNSMAVCDTKGSTVAVSNSSNGRQNSSDKCDAESLIDEKSSVASFYAKRHRKSTFETARIALQVDSYLNPEAAFSKPVTTNSFVSSPYSCIENFIVGCDENDDDSTSSDSQSNISRVAATISSSSTSVANPRNDTGTCKNKCQNEQINLKSAPSQSTNDKESTMNGSKTTENDRRKSNSFFQSLEGSDLPSHNKYSKKKSHQEGKCDNVRSENQHNKGKRRQDYCGDDISMNRGDHTGSSSSSGFQSHRSYSFHEKGLEGQYENKKNANCWSKRNSTYHTYLSKEGKYETRKDYHCSKLFSKDVPESINDISASNYIESKNISWTLDRKGSKTNSTEYSEQDLSYMGSSSCNRK